jgi:hypothetical protein
VAEVDGVALDLCQEAGTALGDALLAAGSGLSAPVLVATGGLLASAPVRQALECRLADDGRALSTSQGGALDGAVAVAAHLLEAGTVPEHPAYLLAR